MNMVDVVMQWLHLLGAATGIGTAIYGRWVAAPALEVLAPEARAKVVSALAARLRPLGFGAIGALLLSGLWNLATHFSGKPPQYHMVFGMKLLLALHVFAMLVIAGLPAGDPARDARRPRQMASAAVSGILILLLSAYLRRGF